MPIVLPIVRSCPTRGDFNPAAPNMPSPPCPPAAHHHGIHGGHGKHGMWGMGSTLVVFDKHRRAAGGSELDGGSEAENLLGGSPGSTINFGGAREKVGGSLGRGREGYHGRAQ